MLKSTEVSQKNLRQDRQIYNPTTRLLTILELLQAHGALSGVDLAARLEVDVRTIRRYITMLQDMAIPIEAERGRHGNYYLRPGYKLPPLMFGEDEALALTLGLLMSRRLGLSADAAAVEGALAKVLRVLPTAINATAQALIEVLVIDLPPAKHVPNHTALVAATLATYRGKQIKLHYQAFNGEETQRTIAPYGIAYRAGYWYIVGYCHLRQDLRTFRLERVLAVEASDQPFERPQDFDVLAFIEQSIANTPGIWTIEVRLDTSLEDARQLIPRTVGLPELTADGVMLRCHVQDLDWFAYFLARLDCPVQVIGPPAAREAMRHLATHIAQMAGAN